MTVALGAQGARLLVSADDGTGLEGVVIDGERDDDGRGELDSQFVLLTDDGRVVAGAVAPQALYAALSAS